jgi:hypothetical protein
MEGHALAVEIERFQTTAKYHLGSGRKGDVKRSGGQHWWGPQETCGFCA